MIQHGSFIALIAAAVVAGCATHRETMHGGSMPDATHLAAMCQLYRATLAGKSPDEQRAAAEAHVRSMHGSATPEHVAHHMRMMETHCGAPGTR
jgi:hypothetical protein